MKHNILTSVFGAFLIAAVISCESTSDTFAEFSSIDEIIYIGKADTVIVSHGYEELDLAIAINSDPKIVSGLIVVNRADTVEFDIVRQNSGTDIVNHKFAIAEGQYTFAVYLLDDQRNYSIAKEVPAIAYGPNYQSVLISRKVTSMAIESDTLRVGWSTVDPSVGMVVTNVSYPNSSGSTVSMVLANGETQSEIADFQTGGTISVTSFFHPTANTYFDFPGDAGEYTIPE